MSAPTYKDPTKICKRHDDPVAQQIFGNFEMEACCAGDLNSDHGLAPVVPTMGTATCTCVTSPILDIFTCSVLLTDATYGYLGYR